MSPPDPQTPALLSRLTAAEQQLIARESEIHQWKIRLAAKLAELADFQDQLVTLRQERDFQQARADKRVAAYERLSGDSAWCERHWPHDYNPHEDCQSCRAEAAESQLAARDAEILKLHRRVNAL